MSAINLQKKVYMKHPEIGGPGGDIGGGSFGIGKDGSQPPLHPERGIVPSVGGSERSARPLLPVVPTRRSEIPFVPVASTGDTPLPDGEDRPSTETSGTSPVREAGEQKEHAVMPERSSSKEVPKKVFLLGHGESEEDRKGVKIWVDEGRKILEKNKEGKVAFVVEDEEGTEEYSKAVTAGVRRGLSPSEAKAHALVDLFFEGPDEERDAMLERAREGFADGFEGILNAELDAFHREFGSEHMDVVVEYHGDDYVVHEHDIPTTFDGLVAASLPLETKVSIFKTVSDAYSPTQRGRDLDLSQIIDDAGKPADVVAVLPGLGSTHLGQLEDLRNTGHTDVTQRYTETFQGRHYYRPLTGVFLDKMLDPETVLQDQDIVDAFELEDRIVEAARGIASSRSTMSRQELFATVYAAYAEETQGRDVPFRFDIVYPGTLGTEAETTKPDAL